MRHVARKPTTMRIARLPASTPVTVPSAMTMPGMTKTFLNQ
jgi:hypothetical protein